MPNNEPGSPSPFIVVSHPRDPGDFTGTDDIDVEDWLRRFERIQDGMAIMSPLVSEHSSDQQDHKLVTLSLASAGSFLLLLVIFPMLVRTSGRRAEAEYGLVDPRIAETNSSFVNGLRRSLDEAAASPCDDFYSFVCGRWSRTYPQLAHQFHLLDNRVRVAALRRVAELSPAAANMSAPNKVGHALALCLGEHESDHDHSSVVAQLLRSVGIDWPKLAAVANRTRTFNFFHAFLTLSQKMGLPLFFQMLPEMDLRYSNRTVLTLSPGWLQSSLSDNRSESNMLVLAALYGREDISQRLSRVHDRVALSAAGLYNVRGSQGPKYTTVDALPGFSVHMPAADVLLAMINTNFPPKNKVLFGDPEEAIV